MSATDPALMTAEDLLGHYARPGIPDALSAGSGAHFPSEAQRFRLLPAFFLAFAPEGFQLAPFLVIVFLKGFLLQLHLDFDAVKGVLQLFGFMEPLAFDLRGFPGFSPRSCPGRYL